MQKRKRYSGQLSALRVLNAPDPSRILLHSLIIHSIGSVLNIAQTFSIRENAMKTFQFKHESKQLEKIAEKIMNARLGAIKLEIKEDLEEFTRYEHASEIYRVIANLAPKNIEYVRAIADELEEKERFYLKKIEEYAAKEQQATTGDSI